MGVRAKILSWVLGVICPHEICISLVQRDVFSRLNVKRSSPLAEKNISKVQNTKRGEIQSLKPSLGAIILPPKIFNDPFPVIFKSVINTCPCNVSYSDASCLGGSRIHSMTRRSGVYLEVSLRNAGLLTPHSFHT